MVGLSVILEGHNKDVTRRSSKVVCKGTMISKQPCTSIVSSTSSAFLESCLLCKQKLLPGKDIYMYKGDRAFCSVECRSKQILMEEEEETSSTKGYNCSLAAQKVSKPSSPSASPSCSRSGKATSNRANAFAY